MSAEPTIELRAVSVFYGEVIGLSGVDLALGPASPASSGRTAAARPR